MFVRHTGLVIEGGVVVGLIILTTGVDSQEDVIRALRDKLGKPTRYTVDRLQNRMGAKFAGVRAVRLRPRNSSSGSTARSMTSTTAN